MKTLKNDVIGALQQSQIQGWKNDQDEVVTFFERFNLDVRKQYRYLTTIEYDRMQVVCYLLAKIRRAIKICDFLDTLEKDNYEDVDMVKLYLLISHAEITTRSLEQKGKDQELVEKFFSPVESELKYKIMPSLSTRVANKNVSFAYILYKLRCEYTHEGNFTGKIFKKISHGSATLLFPFKVNTETLYGECELTYKEFLDIYMKALMKHVDTYSGLKAFK